MAESMILVPAKRASLQLRSRNLESKEIRTFDEESIDKSVLFRLDFEFSLRDSILTESRTVMHNYRLRSKLFKNT